MKSMKAKFSPRPDTPVGSKGFSTVSEAVVIVPHSGPQHTEILQDLTTLNILESTGGRGAIYYIKGEVIPKPEEVFGSFSESSVGSYPNLDVSYPNLDVSSRHLSGSFRHLGDELPAFEL